MTILGEILRLKEHRENKAELAVSASRLVFAEAVQRFEQARGALHDYRDWSVTREKDMYADVCRRVVRARDLEWLREDVVMLRAKERELETLLTQSEKRREDADEHLRQSRAAHQLATRAREKFVQLVEAQSEEMRLENERKEDVEMEDLYAVRKDREDWGEQADD